MQVKCPLCGVVFEVPDGTRQGAQIKCTGKQSHNGKLELGPQPTMKVFTRAGGNGGEFVGDSTDD